MLAEHEISSTVSTYSMFCPKCNKIMLPLNKNDPWSKLICLDCVIIIEPRLYQLRKVRASCEMRTFETKAIDVAKVGNNTVKFSTVDYFPKLIRVCYGDTEFIVDRDDMKRMLSDIQLLKENE